MSGFLATSVAKQTLVPLNEAAPLLACAVDDFLYVKDQLRGSYDTEDVSRIVRRLKAHTERLHFLREQADGYVSYTGDHGAALTVSFLKDWAELLSDLFGNARKAVIDAESKKLDLDRSEA